MAVSGFQRVGWKVAGGIRTTKKRCDLTRRRPGAAALGFGAAGKRCHWPVDLSVRGSTSLLDKGSWVENHARGSDRKGLRDVFMRDGAWVRSSGQPGRGGLSWGGMVARKSRSCLTHRPGEPV